ncbi:MAG: hypothetical protein KZQ87_11020 [Candidatus Thiodiazotropha sp. (ex Cardiolucina cf. quadrata)]|nr:hypothetical protein [Candidatus Thiodiazotropha sp. (ex Cardiolucina cf. quadrata)]
MSRLYAEGYTIALDGFKFEPRWSPLFPHCSIVKVDILHLDIDAYQKQINEIMPEQIIEALKERSGPYAMSLQCAIDLEECHWLTEAAQSMSVERLNSLYLRALECVEMIRGKFA